ncbi:MAG: response regulator [Armatimonadetes bacterium]|nr:response regulator [Armatimonadota bacterium]
MPYRILVADDDPIIRMDLKQQLEALGHIVHAEAGDGEQAIAMTREFKPDIVLMDVRMPVMDGIDAAQALHKDGLAPVVLLTAFGNSETIQRAAHAGVYGYLGKPFSSRDVMPTLEIALSRFQENLALESEVKTLEERLETRKLVERAKGILMDLYNLKEPDAFKRIQDQSMNSRKTMREVAEAILLAHGD